MPESVAVSRVLDDAAVVAGDFRIDQAGHLRFLVSVAPGTGQRRIGRIVQRLCEIETYKSMSMLGFSRVRDMSRQMGEMDEQLRQLMGEMNDGHTPADKTLHDLLDVSAELETLMARSSFRFGATGAYSELVDQRIQVLREERFEGRQTFAEFMMRRFTPAMRTVDSTKVRLGRHVKSRLAGGQPSANAGRRGTQRAEPELVGKHEPAGRHAAAPAAHGRGA